MYTNRYVHCRTEAETAGNTLQTGALVAFMFLITLNDK